MPDALVQIIGGAIITGLGILAYHHPDRYKPLAPYLVGASIAAAMFLMIWLIAVQRTELALSYLAADVPFETLKASTAHLKPSIWLINGFLVLGPLVFGAILPWVGTLKQPSK